MSVRVRLASDLAVGDEVQMPSGRHATVKGFSDGAIDLLTFDGDELALLAHRLVLVRKAPPRSRSQLFREAATAAGL